MHGGAHQGEVGEVEAPHVQLHCPAVEGAGHHPAAPGTQQSEARADLRARDHVDDGVVPRRRGLGRVGDDPPALPVHDLVGAGGAYGVALVAAAHGDDPGPARAGQL